MFESIENRINDQKVWETINKVARHEFVPVEYLDLAYEDRPLPIGHGQTISQPYIVALMTELLELKVTDHVLEIGTGSGYQTAILAELVRDVYTIEIVRPLAKNARKTLDSLGYQNIHYHSGDGYYGWSEYAPYDAIIVAAAAEEVPPELIEQLGAGGRMVIPLGLPGEVQTLWKLKQSGDRLIRENYGAVRFVPFVRLES